MHTSTDYYRGTTQEPGMTSTLRASFEEYDALGQLHRNVSARIENLNEAMKLSRQRGAFQQLQDQMKEVKELVKQKEDLDGKMAVADLARKKDDDHRLAIKQEVSYSENLNSVGDRINQLLEMMTDFEEFSEEEFDFSRCQRPDGSFYGTRGKCKKGTDAGAAVPKPKTGPRLGTKKKGVSQKGPHHEEVMAARGRLRLIMPELNSRKKELSRLSQAARIQEKVVKREKSKESKERLKRIYEALRSEEKVVRRYEREAEKLAKAWKRAYDKNEKAKMTPQQRASESALTRMMRRLG